MRFWTLLFITCFALACKGQAKVSNPEEDKLICIVPGNDSVLYYEGSNSDFQNTKRGRITDTAYMNKLFHMVIERGFLLVVKSGDGQRMLGDYQQMMDQVREQGVTHLAIDSLNWKEEKFFGYTTTPAAKAAIRGDTTTFGLNLPRDEGQDKDSLPGYPKASQIVIIPTGETGHYGLVDITKEEEALLPGISN